MQDTIDVSVVKYPDRPHLVLRWCDPTTGRTRCKTAGTARRKDAERAAARLAQEIANGGHGPAARMTWADFREYHETHCLEALAVATQNIYACVLNTFERFANPRRLSEVTTARVTAWQTHLRTEGKSEATIACYTRHLKAVLGWAKEQKLIGLVPSMPMPKRVKGSKPMKGRAITLEEFERMLAAVPKAIQARPTTTGEDLVEPWRHYLRGLWWSGLRLSESLDLRWDDAPGALVVDFSGERPMLRIPAEAEKGNQDRILPMAPEFAAFLQETPASERRGRVFKLVGKRWGSARMQADWVGRVVCEIGRKAGVVVDDRKRRLVVDGRSRKAKAEPADEGPKRKFASAHDLRRAFGLRWSARLMPAVLQQLMRHESIETTMRYYVGRDANAMADVIWLAFESVDAKSTKTSNIGQNPPAASATEKPQPLAESRLS